MFHFLRKQGIQQNAVIYIRHGMHKIRIFVLFKNNKKKIYPYAWIPIETFDVEEIWVNKNLNENKKNKNLDFIYTGSIGL